MAAAGRRDIGDVPGAEALELLAEPGALMVDVAARRVEVKRQEPARGRAGIVDRDRARLARRHGRQRPDPTRRESAAAVPAHPDVRRSGN